MLGKKVLIKKTQKIISNKPKKLFVRNKDGSKKYLLRTEEEQDKPVHFQLEMEIEKTFTKDFYDHDSKCIMHKKYDTVIEKLISNTYYDKKTTNLLLKRTIFSLNELMDRNNYMYHPYKQRYI